MTKYLVPNTEQCLVIISSLPFRESLFTGYMAYIGKRIALPKTCGWKSTDFLVGLGFVFLLYTLSGTFLKHCLTVQFIHLKTH